MTASSPAGVEGLAGARFDAVVVGGGILGAGVALALAERGNSCLLVEKADFGVGTTARSTRLIHGGLRYLAMFDFGLVREGLTERAWLLNELPNLVRPLPMLLPHYGQPLWQRARIFAGLTLYDLLSPFGSLPHHRHLSRAALQKAMPALRPENLQSGERFWDGQAELPERLVIEALRRAEAAGAVVRNHVEAQKVVRPAGRITAITLRDQSTGRGAGVSTNVVINATGPWADEVLKTLGVERPPLLRLSQGVHLVYPRFTDEALAIPHPSDDRLSFVLPWQGATLVGTTDTDIDGGPDSARVTPAEVDYLRRLVDERFSAAPEPTWAMVGVRSLARPGEGRRGLPQSVSRRHVLVNHGPDGARGLYTLAGGKLTAWRATGRFVADGVGAMLPARARSRVARARSPELRHDDGDRLWALYGARAGEVRAIAATDPYWAEPLVPGASAIRAEVAHAIDKEWALSVADIVLRRLALGFGEDLGRSAAVAVANVCRERFGWTDARVACELAALTAETDERRLPA
jgi:glycerol-3-phosphate dehydrogenase